MKKISSYATIVRQLSGLTVRLVDAILAVCGDDQELLERALKDMANSQLHGLHQSMVEVLLGRVPIPSLTIYDHVPCSVLKLGDTVVEITRLEDDIPHTEWERLRPGMMAWTRDSHGPHIPEGTEVNIDKLTAPIDNKTSPKVWVRIKDKQQALRTLILKPEELSVGPA